MSGDIQVEGVQPQGTNSTTARVAAHSHIHGLGLDERGFCLPGATGLIGQSDAREAAGLIVDLIRAKKLAGKAVLLAGPPGTGKTAIALAISRDLGTRVPFCALGGAEVYSQEVKKTEVLMECLRRAIGLRIREVKDVYEGEVTELSVEETENPHGGYAKSVSGVIVTLKTARGSKTLKLAPQMHEGFQKQKVQIGDVIYIESQTGMIKRVGRCDTYAHETDLEIDEYVPIPKGQVYKSREVVQDLTLYDLDVANSKPQGSSDVASILSQYLAPRKTEITDRLRHEVDKVVDKYISDGLAELTPGVLFVDEAHMLDMECFAFLNRAVESEYAPVLIFATNRGVCRVKGTEDMISPHGIPVDFLDRLLIIKTGFYNAEDAMKIIAIRAKVEGVNVTDDGFQRLASIATSTSLRYSIQLLSPASIIARCNGRKVVTEEHIQAADLLFLDGKSSAQRLLAQS